MHKRWETTNSVSPNAYDDLQMISAGRSDVLSDIAGMYVQLIEAYQLEMDCVGDEVGEHFFVLWMAGHHGTLGVIYHSVDPYASASCVHIFASDSGTVPEAAVMIAQARVSGCTH